MSEAFTVTFAPVGTWQAFDVPNCDAWVVRGIMSFDDFIAFYDRTAAANPNYQVLSTFDDYIQACYTSGHAMGKYDLDPPDDVEAEPQPSRKRFDIIHAKFMALTGKATFSQLAGRLTWGPRQENVPSELQETSLNHLELNARPEACLDETLVLQIVPVGVPEDALSAFPSGYFVVDLTPFENHALAAHLRHEHGYKLVAIGASYMCFLRDQAADARTANAVATDVATLFRGTNQQQVEADLENVLLGKRHLILCYVDRL
jgi:hypothetical protein